MSWRLRKRESTAAENAPLLVLDIRSLTPEPKHVSGPSGLSAHKPAAQALIRPRRTRFALIHAYKEVGCLVVEVYFVISG